MLAKIVISCFTCCLFILTFSNCGLSLKTLVNKKYFQLEELTRSSKFKNKYFNGSWISGTEFIYSKIGEKGIFLYNLSNQNSTLFLPEDVVEKLKTRDLIVSPDQKFLLAYTDAFKNHVQIITWRLALYDIENRNLTHLAGNRHIRQFMFFRNHSLIYNIDNNVYYIEDASVSLEALALTTDGIPGRIYNGVPDYIYGDVFYRKNPLTWISKDGVWLAIARFDDTNLDNATFFTYGKPRSIDDQYPKTRHVKYSEVGKSHPDVCIKVLNLKNAANPKWLIFNPPVEIFGEELLLTTALWASESELAITWMNRVQNKSVLIMCDVNTARCENEVFRQENHGWIEVTTPVFSRSDPKYFLDINPLFQNDTSKGEFFHIVKYTRGEKTSEVMTSGIRTVANIVGWNEDADLIYYEGTLEEIPWKYHLYVAGSRNECISCDMISPYGELCDYATAKFSPGDKYFALTCGSRAPTYTVLYDAQTGKRLIMWQDNEEFRRVIDGYHFPQTKYLRIPLPGSDVFFKISFPPQFDPDDTNVTYPLIVHIYAGPSVAKVLSFQDLDHEEFWATNRSYIYARIEGRGSAYKGSKIHYGSYRRHGTVEVDDVINGTRYLLDNYSWIDKKNVVIWGWSYGGYACLNGLARDYHNIYKCGVCVAPLFDLREFISMRIEGSMGRPTPDDNLKGYDDANFLNHALNLRGKKFAILHGNADENAHYGKTLQLFHILQTAGIDFEQMSYPEEAHTLLGVLPHVYNFIDDFWSRCFSS